MTGRSRSEFADLPAGRFHYRYWPGPENGSPPALLLHGGTASAETWGRIGPGLADTRAVYALDLRGHGSSPAFPAGAYHLDRVAADVADFLTVLNLRPLLVGHSWGAAVALVLATTGETPLSALVLAELPPTMATPALTEFAEAGAELAGRPTEVLRRYVPAILRDRDPADIDTTIHGLHHTTPTAIRAVITDGARHGDLLPLLARVPAPTLLVRSDPTVRSEIGEPDWARARRLLPTSGRTVTIPGADHDLHRTHPRELLAAIAGLERNPATTTKRNHG